MTSSKITEIALYTGAQLISMVADFTVFLTLTQIFGQPVIESLIGYTCALLSNYYLMNTFIYAKRATQKSQQRIFAQFMATGVLGLIMTGGIIWTNTFFIGAEPAAAKTVACVTCFVVLYFVRSRLVFADAVPVQA